MQRPTIFDDFGHVDAPHAAFEFWEIPLKLLLRLLVMMFIYGGVQHQLIGL